MRHPTDCRHRALYGCSLQSGEPSSPCCELFNTEHISTFWASSFHQLSFPWVHISLSGILTEINMPLEKIVENVFVCVCWRLVVVIVEGWVDQNKTQQKNFTLIWPEISDEQLTADSTLPARGEVGRLARSRGSQARERISERFLHN